VRNAHHLQERSKLDESPVRRLAVAATYSMTASMGSAPRRHRLASGHRTTAGSARVTRPHSIAFPGSQQFRRPFATRWRAVSVRVHRWRPIGRFGDRLGRRDHRPTEGRIKATRCGAVGVWGNRRLDARFFFRRSLHFRRMQVRSMHGVPRAAFSSIMSAVGRSVAPRALRPFCSAPVPWHAVTMARSHKSRPFIGQLGDLAAGPAKKK
jgi:hypothetical protein